MELGKKKDGGTESLAAEKSTIRKKRSNSDRCGSLGTKEACCYGVGLVHRMTGALGCWDLLWSHHCCCRLFCTPSWPEESMGLGAVCGLQIRWLGVLAGHQGRVYSSLELEQTLSADISVILRWGTVHFLDQVSSKDLPGATVHTAARDHVDVWDSWYCLRPCHVRNHVCYHQKPTWLKSCGLCYRRPCWGLFLCCCWRSGWCQ